MIQWAECVRFKRGERKREGEKKRGGRCKDASQSMCLCVVSLNALKDAGEKFVSAQAHCHQLAAAALFHHTYLKNLNILATLLPRTRYLKPCPCTYRKSHISDTLTCRYTGNRQLSATRALTVRLVSKIL